MVFDHFFTLAEPVLGDFTDLADQLGCSERDIAVGRREMLPIKPLTSGVFEGEADDFRPFYDHWVDFGDALFEQLAIEGGGHAYAQDRRLAHRNAVLYPDGPGALQRSASRGGDSPSCLPRTLTTSRPASQHAV